MNRAPASLLGSIERVAFHNADNVFVVLKIAVKGYPDLITVVRRLAFGILTRIIRWASWLRLV